MRFRNLLAACSLSGALALVAAGCTDADVESTSAATGPSTARVLVKYKNATGRAAALSGAASVHHDFSSRGVIAATMPAAAVHGLSMNPNIEYVEEDAVRSLSAETVPYGIPMVQADLLSDAAAGNVTVCIIDSGYSMQHEDLQDGNVTASPDSGTGDPFYDDNGHGTHVAGTIAALGGNGEGVVGVNPGGNLHIHVVKVFTAAGWAYSSSLVHALDECEANAPAGNKLVINMSLGGSFKSRTEDKAFAAANSRGVLSIAAAGNDGNTRKSYPASYSSVVSVAAVDNTGTVADFSQNNDQVELAAPGVAVESSVPWLGTHALTVDGVTFSGNYIDFAAQPASGTGALVDGGLCDSTGAWAGAVVLCARGDISFYDKVHNAELGGANAVAIYNNAPGNFLGTLGEGNSSSIPAISLSQEDGQALVASSLGSSGTVVSQTEFPASGYEAWDGTSMATPHVVGVAALVWSNHLDCSNDEIRAALNATATDLGPAGVDTAYGNGLVQALGADSYLNANGCGGDGGDGGGGDGGGGGGGGTCDLAPVGASCTSDADCCSNKCKGPPSGRTCR